MTNLLRCSSPCAKGSRKESGIYAWRSACGRGMVGSGKPQSDNDVAKIPMYIQSLQDPKSEGLQVRSGDEGTISKRSGGERFRFEDFYAKRSDPTLSAVDPSSLLMISRHLTARHTKFTPLTTTNSLKSCYQRARRTKAYWLVVFVPQSGEVALNRCPLSDRKT